MNGFNLTELDELIRQMEQMGADANKITERVLDAGCEPARQAFIKNVPYDDKTPEGKRRHGHARDHVTVSKTKKAKRGNKYRVIGALDQKFSYLYYLENGTVKSVPKRFIDKAYQEAHSAAKDPMEQALIREIENHLR